MVAGDLNLMKRLEILQVQKNGTIVENLGVGTSWIKKTSTILHKYYSESIVDCCEICQV